MPFNYLFSSKKAVEKEPSSSTHIVKKQSDLKKKTSVEDLREIGYAIGEKLGEGSYCKVRAASYKGKDMAVKIITRMDLSVDFESKFLPREIEILGRIKHDNIIQVYKIFSYPKRIYIFMERIGRGDLLFYIRNRGRMINEEAAFFFGQMVDAILYLHGIHVAHRDLKCENIMITDDDVVKIIDFGFCRYTVNEDGKRELSRTFCGSTAYAAPEVLQGIAYNPMMYDVWSLGCVLFIMVTGTMPFDDSNVRKMVGMQLKRQFRYPSTFSVNQGVQKLISRMLEPDVTRRATIRQVSDSDWIAKGIQRYNSLRIASHELDDSDSAEVESSVSISTGTQTEEPGQFGRFNFRRKN